MYTPRILFDNEFEWVVQVVRSGASYGQRDAIDAVREVMMEAHFASVSTPTSTTRRGL